MFVQAIFRKGLGVLPAVRTPGVLAEADAEYQEEITGIAEGLRARDIQYDARISRR